MAPNIGLQHDSSGEGRSTVSVKSKTFMFDTMLPVHRQDTIFEGRHLVDLLTDEIALEGLDGITFQALAVRLEQRLKLEMEGFEDVVAKAWNQLKLSKSFQFYMLPEDRPFLINYGWNDYRDGRGNVCEPPNSPEDIYPYFPIENEATGVRGSCEHYKTRKDVSNVVRRLPYGENLKLFGSRLIIVAIQSVREQALFGRNFKKYRDLSIAQYCVMERVGRSRYRGEVTRGKISLQTMEVPAKMLFHIRKALLDAQLVTKQTTYVKFENFKCPALITVFHLPRFYNRIESVASINTRVMFSRLNNSETKSIPRQSIVSTYGKHMLRNMLDQFPELLETAWEKLYPIVQNELEENEPIPKCKSKAVKVVRLKVHEVDLSTIQKILQGQNHEDTEHAEGEDRDEVKVSYNSSNSFSSVKHLCPDKQFTSVTQSILLWRALLRSGVKGLTVQEMTYFGITSSEARSATKHLIRNNIAEEGVVKHCKQKAFTYTFRKFAESKTEIISSLQKSYEAVVRAYQTSM